jgi:hypothetical protein
MSSCNGGKRSVCWYEISVRAITWKDTEGACVSDLAMLFVYAVVDKNRVTCMKMLAPTKNETVMASMPDYWSSDTQVVGVHAPRRGHEPGGWMKCPACNKDSETLVIRTARMLYHKCCKCGAIIETCEGKDFS